MRPIVDIPGRLTRATDHSTGAYGDEHNGMCFIKLHTGIRAAAIFSNGEGWEHVSVSTRVRCLRWEEMCEVRDLFWPPDVWVVQFHPPASDYVNLHPYCLHLWRPTGAEMPTPPSWMVG